MDVIRHLQDEVSQLRREVAEMRRMIAPAPGGGRRDPFRKDEGGGRRPDTSGGASPDLTSDRMVERARQYLKKYDKNGNGVLDLDEWPMSRLMPPAEMDTNGDEKITEDEVIAYFRKRFNDGRGVRDNESGPKPEGRSNRDFRPGGAGDNRLPPEREREGGEKAPPPEER